jgi:capsule polysaccharide export protein KpsE/RkpR
MESDRPDLVRMREITVSTTNELNLIQNEISSLERLDLRARLAYPQYNQKLGSLKSRRITVRNRLSNLQQLKSSIVIDNYNNFDGGGPPPPPPAGGAVFA